MLSSATTAFSVEGQAQVSASLRWLERFAAAVQSRALGALAAKVKDQTRERFLRTKQSPDGEPWRPWSPAYAATRKRRHSLLIDTRKLLRSLAVVPITGGFAVGTSRPYAPHVQRTRPFIGIGQRDVPELQTTLDRWAEQEMRRRGYQ